MAICGGGDASLSTMGFGGFICHNTRCVYMYAVFFYGVAERDLAQK